jgi:hypothetical protein
MLSQNRYNEIQELCDAPRYVQELIELSKRRQAPERELEILTALQFCSRLAVNLIPIEEYDKYLAEHRRLARNAVNDV